jgi:hypothetical protein
MMSVRQPNFKDKDLISFFYERAKIDLSKYDN